MSAESLRNKVGISFRNKFRILGDKADALIVLARIANDLAEREVVLGNIWDNAGKEAYLQQLEHEGVLPTVREAQTAFPGFSEERSARPLKITKPVPYHRKTLIPQKEYGIEWTGSQERIHEIWDELQFRLLLDEHPNAISVLLRVLIELSVEYYIVARAVQANSNDKLSLRMEKAASDLFARGLIEKKDLDRVRKFQQNHSMISTDTLNRFVHSFSISPSREQLTTIWDSLSDIVVRYLNEKGGT